MVFKDHSLFDHKFRQLGVDVGASAEATRKIDGKGVAVDPNVSITPPGRIVAGELGGVAYLPDADLNQR